MKSLTFRNNIAIPLLRIFILFFLSVESQGASNVGRVPVVETLNGKVIIKLEPHGSIRAKVLRDQTQLYEFILDREAQQKLLTQTIDRANIYLLGKQGEELVIDDLKTHKRYLLSIFDGESRLKNIPPAQRQTITIKGYAVSLLR